MLDKKQITILVLIISLAGFFIFNNNFKFSKNKVVKASHCGTHNVSGWAWTNTPQSIGDPQTGLDQGLGWISFNCANQDTGSDYGVDIDSVTGLISGYAWSESVGWITFNPSEFGSGCPDPDLTCEQANVPTTGSFPRQINGWARVLSMATGSDGWIHLSGSTYATTIDALGNISGWAWGDTVIGWLSFSCSNQGVCGPSNYQVTSTALLTTPTGLGTSLDIVDQNDYCQETFSSGGQDAITFSWTSGGSSFDLQVDSDGDGIYEGGEYTWTGITTSNTTNRTSVVPLAAAGYTSLSPLTYNWQVRADGGTWVNSTFTLTNHDWPLVSFTWLPLFPAISESTDFTDGSTCYDGGSSHDCTPSGETFNWTFTDGAPSSSTDENPVNIQFGSSGSKLVTLTVDDGDGSSPSHTCTASKTVDVGLTIPIWKEISP